MSDIVNPLQVAQAQLKQACDQLNLDPGVYELLEGAGPGDGGVYSR